MVGMRTSLVVALIAIIAISMLPMILSSETQYFRIVNVSWGVEASPGDLNIPLTIYVQYIWVLNLISITGNLTLPSGFLSTNGGSTSIAYSGPTAPGSIVPLTFYVSINPDTALGSYTASLYLTGQASSFNLEQTLGLTIDLRGRADLVFDAYPRNLSPGDINQITLRVYNRGSGSAYNLSISYSLQGQGSVLSAQPATIDSIQPGSYQDLKIQIYVPPSASLQTLNLLVSASYVNPYYSAKAISQSIGLYVGQQPVQMISVTPLTQSLTAGQINQVSLRVSNKGPSNIYSVIATISSSQQAALIGSDGRFFIGDLASSGYKDISFNLYVSPQTSQIVSLQIQLGYTDKSGIQRSDLIGVSFSVDYQPGFFQVLSTSWGSQGQQIQVGPGDSGVMLTIMVRYIGNSTAYNANFTLIPSSGIKILPNQQGASQYIPAVQPNSIVQLAYQVGIDPGLKTGLYSANLSITWDTQSRTGYSQIFSVLLDIRGRADLYVSVASQPLDPGSVNFVSISVVNNGSGAARQVSIASIQPSIGSIISFDQRKVDLSPGGSTAFSMGIYVPLSAQQSPLSLLITLSYIDPYGYPRSYSQQLGLFIGIQKQSLILIEPITTGLSPGSVNSVSVRVSNTGDNAIYNVTVGVSSQLQGVASLTPNQLISILGPGNSSILGYQIYVPPLVAGSTITLLFTISYVDQYGVSKTLSQQLGFYVSSSQQSLLIVNTSNNTIQPGFNNISLYIVNSGSTPIYNLSLTISPAAPLALVNSDGNIYVGSLAGGGVWSSQLIIFMPRSSAVPQQMYSTNNMRITLAYYDQSGSLRTETRDLFLIAVIPPVASPIEVALEPPILITGIINNATLLLRNTGPQSIDNITVSIAVSGQISIIGSNSFQVRRLSSGEQLEIPLRIYIPATASPTASLQVSLGYYLVGAYYQDSKSLGIISRGIIEIKVTDYTIIPETPSPGQVFSITVTLTNQGTITASAVTAIPQQVQGFRIFGSRSTFIGDMQVNSPTTFTVTLIASNTTSPGRYEIPVQLIYYDNLRVLNTMNISIPIFMGAGLRTTTQPRNQGGLGVLDLSSYWWVYVIIAAIIAFVAGNYIGRRGR